MDMQPILVGKRQAAQLLGISVRKVEYLLSLKLLPTIRCDRRVLIPYKALLEFAKCDHVQP